MRNSIVGEEIDGYLIQEVLGQGGMGVVYKAEDVALSRPVALKSLNPRLAGDEAFLRRFRSEARAIARINSPYIVQIYDLSETEIGLVIVMEYVEGRTLKQWITAGDSDWTEALSLIQQMLRALQHAHDAGVIHRDIKPRNILLSDVVLAHGIRVKMTDFGLAKVNTSGDRSRTVTEGVYGTLNYMSPEQVEGHGEIDHRSDLYSVGMTVYEMLTGVLPFDDDSSEFTKMRRIVEEELPRPDELDPQVPDGLSALVMKALEKDPDDRFQSAVDMREAFEAFEETRGDGAPSPPPPTESAEESPSSGSGWARIGGVGVLALLIVGIVLWLILGSSPPRTPLSVSTEPSNARVLVDDSLIGTTPLSGTIEGRRARIQVQRAGFVSVVDTVTQLANRDSVSLNHRLVAKPTPLTVRTDPDSADVYLGDKDTLIGVTPLETVLGGRQVQRYAERGSRVRIGLQKEGYHLRDTLLAVARADRVRLDVQLEPVRRFLSVSTEPSEAHVVLNGEKVGRTPLQDQNVRSDTVQIQVERKGYEPVDSLLHLSQLKTQLRLQLEPKPGTLTLSAVPSGTVFVNGESRSSGESIRVPPGTHRIRFQRSGHEKEATLTVGAGEARRLTCYFEHDVVVQSDPRASVFINEEDTGEDTEYRTELGPGKYRIEVRKQGAESWKVTGGEYRRRGEERTRKFSGGGKTITLEPAFQRETHVIDFQLSNLPPPIATLLDIDDPSVLTERLDELVTEGQLVRGEGPGDFFAPGECYVFIVDPESEAVEAVLGPETNVGRTNLRSGNTVDDWSSQYADKRQIWALPTNN